LNYAHPKGINMELGLRGKRALVCGSSQGLGLACATALAQEGVDVWLNGRDAKKLEQVAAQLQATLDGASKAHLPAGRIQTIAADMTTADGRAAMLAACPDPDILVNNNAGPPPGTLEDWTPAAWDAVLQANMLAPIFLIQSVVRGMQARRFGRIINITSAMVKSPRSHQGLSTTARTGLTAFSKALALDVARDNVTINNLLPERIASPRQDALTERQAKQDGTTWDEARQKLANTVAAKRFGTLEEFASACAYLCSAQASFISGQNLQLDGGSYAGLM
jgi:3-oxoacyl-[acyl-carrier protein] reductase